MGRSLIGFLLLLFGIGFLLQQADVVDFDKLLSHWWPLILIIIGFVQLAYRRHSSVVSGMLFIVIGGLLLIGQFVDYNMWDYIWPLILVIVGASFLLSRSRNGQHKNDQDHIKVFTLFSGANIRNQSTAFKGGTVTAVFGGSEIDLRNAVIADDAVIDITALFGGVTLHVPYNTKVEISGVPIFGGWQDRTLNKSVEAESESHLKLHCHPFMGGIEVKN